MILAIDIGNTNIVIGGFDKDVLSFVAEISTDERKTVYEYSVTIADVLNLQGIDKASVDGAIISSVVPILNSTIKKAIKFAYSVEALVIGPGIKTGINIHCDTPSSVGSDLICSAVAAHSIYGSPVIVIDMDTATKILAVDDNGTFIGVSIVPGVNISLKALIDSTAQLPQISLEAPRSVVGKNTVDSMRSGVLFGNACMIDGMIEKFYIEMGKETQVIATGSTAKNVIPYCNHNIMIDDYLVLKGMNLIYKKNS